MRIFQCISFISIFNIFINIHSYIHISLGRDSLYSEQGKNLNESESFDRRVLWPQRADAMIFLFF